MKNVITVEKVNSTYTDVCLSSQADGTNAITVDIYPISASNPKLKIYLNGTLNSTVNLTNNARNNVAISSSLFVVNGIITFTYVDGSFSSDTFTINFPDSLNGNLMLAKITDFTFEARYTVESSSGDISDYTVDTISTETADYPEVVAGNKVSVIIGKIKKFLSDLKSKKVDKAGDTMTGKLQANGGISSSGFTASKILVTDANKNIVSGSLAESDLITTSNIGNQSVNYAASAGSAGSVSRATFGDKYNAEHNANNMTSNGLYYYTSNGPATSLGASTADGAMYVQAYNSSWVGQIAQDYINGTLFVRGKNNGTWQAWKKILDSTNGILRDSDNGSAAIYWKEYGYGDKFRIVPQFSGVDDSNYLRFQGAVGGAGTDPSLYDLMYITGKSGNMWLKGSLSIATAQRITYGTACSIESLGSNNTICICGNAYAQVRRYDNRNTNQGIYAAAFTVSSSKLIKENVKNLSEEEAKKLLDIRVVDFDYIEKVGGEKNQHGVIAEEVLDIIPSVVTVPDNYDENTEKQKIESDSDELINVLGVDYAKFTPYLIKMVQMQQQQIDDMQKQINELKDLIKGGN